MKRGEGARVFKDEKQLFDLTYATLCQLCEEGVPPQNVTVRTYAHMLTRSFLFAQKG